MFKDIRRNRVLVFDRKSAASPKNLRVTPLGAVVTHKVRINNDYLFEAGAAGGEEGGLNRDTLTEEVPKCLRGDAPPSLLKALTDLRIRFPHLRIPLAKANVTDAIWNFKIAPHQAQNFCYVVDDVLVSTPAHANTAINSGSTTVVENSNNATSSSIQGTTTATSTTSTEAPATTLHASPQGILVSDLRRTFGWAPSPGYWGLMAAAVEHPHCNTTVDSPVILPEGKARMPHVKIGKPWETGTPTQIPTGVRVNAL